MKTLYIVRGIPGSKEHLAKIIIGMKLTSKNFQCHENQYKCPLMKHWAKSPVGFQTSFAVHSTDNYFVVDGKYIFDATKLGGYHKKNQKAVEESCKKGYSAIVVDNTNLTWSEIKPYVKIALDNKYKISIVNSFFSSNAEFYAQQSNLEVSVIEGMIKKFKPGFFEEEIKKLKG